MQVNAIENRLTNLIKTLKCSTTNDVKKNKKRNMLEIVELILYFNQQNQVGKELKIPTPSQCLLDSQFL